MAGRGRSDGSPPKSSGSGLTRTARTLVSGGPISTEIRPTSRRSTARNMSPAAAAQRRKRRKRRSGKKRERRPGSTPTRRSRREADRRRATIAARRNRPRPLKSLGRPSSREREPCSRYKHALPAHGGRTCKPAPHAPVRSASITPILPPPPQQASARIPDRIGQHGVKLTLGEFSGRRRGGLRRSLVRLRHHPVHRLGAGCRRCRLSCTHSHDFRIGRWRLVTALVAHAFQLGAHGVAAMAKPACDLTGAVSCSPELFEQCYVFRIPTHGRYLYT